MTIFDHINAARQAARDRRPGFYVSKVSDALQSFRRVQHVPAWLDEGAMDRARRIASPILDVIPAAGARLAMLSEDGDPDRAAWIGQIWDGAVEELTVWLRANLAGDPGRLEIGAGKSIHIRIGAADGDASGGFDLTALDDGSIVIEGAEAHLKLLQTGEIDLARGGTRLSVSAFGQVRLESGAGALEISPVGRVELSRGGVGTLEQLSSLCGQVSSLCTQVATSTTATLLGPQPLSNAGVMLSATKVQVEAAKGLLDTMRIT